MSKFETGSSDLGEKLVEEAARLVSDLVKCQQELDAARSELSRARSRETSAINALNTTQKEFDSFVSAARQAAPSDTDWHRAARDRRMFPTEQS